MRLSIRQSFLQGMARTLDIGGLSLMMSPIRQRYISGRQRFSSSYLLPRYPERLDAHRLSSDFAAIAEDIRVATLQAQD